jgi:secondary thiamine-phosphate synthase enzyme
MRKYFYILGKEEIMVHTGRISLSTKGFFHILDITGEVSRILVESGLKNGLVTVFCPGSTGAVTSIEYEDGVLNDLQRVLERLVPSNMPYEHDKRWGDGNGFSHVRAALMKPSLTIPLVEESLTLGTWQQIVFIDFDNRERRRDLIVQIVGD